MIFGDSQTKHFYAMKEADTATVKDLQYSDLFRIEIKQGSKVITTDIIDRKLIKKIKVKQVEPTYFRTWTVSALDSTSISEGKTYYIYFYLENMMGFGIQNRVDRVAAYTAKNGDTVSTVMTALKNELDRKLNGAGPIKGDFEVTLTNDNDIVVSENPKSDTYTYTKMDMLTNGYPYEYNVTMSVFDGETVWKNQKEITANNNTNIDAKMSAAKKVLAMERYFIRNRADLYQLTKPFGVSIINETNTDVDDTTYYTLDIDYAFSDTQGYTYHSNKQLSIACPTKSTLTTLMESILNDSNADAHSQESDTTEP